MKSEVDSVTIMVIILLIKFENPNVKNSKWTWSSKDFIEYSNIIEDVYEIIEEYNLDKKRKVLTVFNVVIADKIINKKLTTYQKKKIKHFYYF